MVGVRYEMTITRDVTMDYPVSQAGARAVNNLLLMCPR